MITSPRRADGALRPGALRVVLDYRPALFGRGGICTYAAELAAGYAAAFPGDRLALWGHRLRRADGAPPAGAPRGAVLHRGRCPSLLVTTLGRLGLGVDGLAGGADVLHWTDYVTLPSRRAAVVATVHDVLFMDLPSCYTSRMRAGLRAVTTRIVRRADRLIVPSERSRDALVAHFRADPGRVDVVAHGVTPLPPAAPAQEHGRYVLFVGTLEPRKNLARLLRAHERLRGAAGELALVVAGPRGWMDEDVATALARQRRVVWEGRVGRERLAALYRGAVALAYPSLGEGFGLPVLEAMAEGRPVLVGRGTACADLAGDAGLAVDPRDVGAIAGGLERLADDDGLCRDLAARGRARAEAYTWEAAARATRATYERALSS